MKENYQSTDATVRELYYALYALNRMDNNEGRYPFDRSDATGVILPVRKNKLNGFFDRDDNYIRNSTVRPTPNSDPNYNNYFNTINNKIIPIAIDNSQGNTSQVSDFGTALDFQYNGTPEKIKKDQDGASMSQDHLSSILVAMALVKKCVDGGVYYGNAEFQDQERGMVEEAVKITERIMDYMFDGPQPYHNAFPFLLAEPDGDLIGRGNFAIALSHGFASAASTKSQTPE